MEITTITQAMQLHAQILKSGHDHNGITSVQSQQNLSKLFTFSALSSSGDLSYARLILNSLPSPNSYFYNTMIRAYSDSHDPMQALHFFLKMLDRPIPNTPRPDKFTFPFVLKSCSKLRRTRFGSQLHGLLEKFGLGEDLYINNALIHMYSGCGVSEFALKVFDKMIEKDVVSWTSIIDGLVDNDKPIKAIELFEQMVENGIEFNQATVVSVLRACADTGALTIGRQVHNLVKEKKLRLDGKVCTALIDMYAKCGCIDTAAVVFNETVNKDVVAWTVMIAGRASHGQSEEAIKLFEQMKNLEIKPDERTLTSVLAACRNAGWDSKGLALFRGMKKYKIRPTVQHYGCLVDMLAQAGRLEEAEQVIKKVPVELDAMLWSTLISACKIHGDLARSERLMKHLEPLNIEPECESYALGDVSSTVGRSQEKDKIVASMNRRGLAKVPGHSRIEINGKIHEFVAGDLQHLEVDKIYEKMIEVEENLRGQGYDPKLCEAFLRIDNEEKGFQLLHHSEKLAVSFGLTQTSPGTPIMIVKNLRCCEDCHSFMSLLSKVYQRNIMIRDRVRIHHFRNGDCSCQNNW
ncbi:hypothetical protein M9H77_18982 [Catharanthus roseus]|uniref:Uncharacterized protein n=1 Tax=Catharanthus roseus TaxID=4058 RepID=A0ACC0B918_CATRO|nr:hypothetical protein M9H77_18982 [Catharanthus roseus]